MLNSWRILGGASCICISRIPSTTLLGMSKTRRPAIGASVFPPPYSPDLATADIYLFDWLKQRLSGRTLDSEENVLEMITEILNELP
jgi:transposase